MKLMSIAGARPNFMKLASIADGVENHNRKCSENTGCEHIEHLIVHTGQHYDSRMSQWFFEELEIPLPDVNLGVGSGSHSVQTAEIMKKFEPVLLKEMPDALLVVGDVNSTIACTLVASKIQYISGKRPCRPYIIHVEAGLRSFDRTMPEEINRILTDALSDMLFVTEESAIVNLKQEGISPEKIHFVGNVMIDTLSRHLQKARSSGIKKNIDLTGSYGLVTLHRPSNVDASNTLDVLVECLKKISNRLKLLFPLHPRTRDNLVDFNLLNDLESCRNIILTEPLGYLDFLNLLKDAAIVLTDSGGIQEETTFLNIPCITLRENTERPVTVTKGSNYLTGTDPKKVLSTVDLILNGKGKKSAVPELWDGKAGDRIIAQIVEDWNRWKSDGVME